MPAPSEQHGGMLSIVWTDLPGEVSPLDDTILLTLDGKTCIVSVCQRTNVHIVVHQRFSPSGFALLLCLCAFPSTSTLALLACAILQAQSLRSCSDLSTVRAVLLASQQPLLVEADGAHTWLVNRLSKLRKKLAPLGLDLLYRKEGFYCLFRHVPPAFTTPAS